MRVSTENVVIEGTDEELRALTGKLVELYPPRTWLVHTVWGLCEHDVEVFYTEEAAIAGFHETVARIEKDSGRKLEVDGGFATDGDDWEVRML